MKASTVSLTLWFAQVLKLCALHENLLTTPELDVSIMTSENLTTNQDFRLKTVTVAAMTTTTSAHGVFSDLTLPLSPTQGLSSFTSLVDEDGRNQKISTSHHNIMSLTEANNMSLVTGYQEKGNGTESMNKNIQEMTEMSTSIQLDHDVQRTLSKNRTEDGTSDSDDANTITMSLIYSTHEAEESVTNRSFGTTSYQSPLPSTAGTSHEIRFTNQTSPDFTTNTDTPAETSGHITAVHSTPVASDFTESTEEHVVSSTKIMDWEIETTDEPLVSSTKMMNRKTERNTEALTTTQGTFYENTTNTTQRDTSQPTNSGNSWSTNITTSKDNSTNEPQAPNWTNCFSEDSSSPPRRFSKLVCFITMWTLALTASFFLGLTVFLWVRLSITKKRARHRGRRGRDGKGQGPAAKEKESLWAEPGSSAEERVEFWYANGATVEEGRRRHRARQVRMRTNGERVSETEEDMWMQPKVTLKDITEFWHANGRVRHAEETQGARERDKETESDDQRHTE